MFLSSSCGGAVPGLAQLPPEILADSYLLRGEQAIEEGDPSRARAEIDKILDLEKEHELDLGEEFHFRYAKAAAAAGLPEQALEAVEKYLTLAGREGRHYVEALELMNKAQDAIEGRQEPQAASSGQSLPAQTIRQGPVEPEVDAGGPPEVQEEKQALLNTAGTTEVQTVPDCGTWNTQEFFRSASVGSVTACLAAGADPMARSRDEDTPAYSDGQSTPLHHAARSNENPAVIDALLKAGADPMARNEFKNTPLHRAAESNENPAVIDALLKAGADPMARNKFKSTPLHYAAGNNENPAVVDALLKAGADPMARNEFKNTPLHRAAESNENPAVIETLIKAGADARTVLKWSPLHLAAINNENPAAIETLIKAGADPMSLDVWKNTPLHWATRFNKNPSVIDALIRAGADPMARNEFKDTPLHSAAWSNSNPSVIETLIRAGADPMARDKWKGTPLHDAARFNENPEVVQALLAAGADPMAQDKRGDIPLDDAIGKGNVTAIEVLRDPTAVRGRELAAARRTNAQKSGSGGLGALIAAATVAGVGAASGADSEAILTGVEAVAAGQQAVTGGEQTAVARSSVGTSGSMAGNAGSCEVPGYPRPSNPQSLGLSWCPASVSFQLRVFALQAAGAQCAIATGSSPTPEQIQARHREIVAACGRLAALSARDGINCRCPAGLGESGYSVDHSAIERENQRREQQARQQEEARLAAERERQARQAEEARQAAQRAKRRIEESKLEVLNSDCSCIGVEDDGGYVCNDGFVQSGDATKPLCDIRR